MILIACILISDTGDGFTVPFFVGQIAQSLLLMREVASPLGEDGGREADEGNALPQSFALQNPAPSSEGAVGAEAGSGAVFFVNSSFFSCFSDEIPLY